MPVMFRRGNNSLPPLAPQGMVNDIGACDFRHFLRTNEMNTQRLIAPLAAALLFGVAACSSDKPEYVEKPVEELYNTALGSLNNEEFEEAAKQFDEVERQHPYSVWATKAQLMSAYAYYQDDEYDSAIIALDRFIQLHPGNRDIGYAYYLKALSYYEQISDIERDQKMTRLALDALEEVVNRFPDSRYGRDAKIKVDLTLDHLAGKEMEVGRFYQTRHHYPAAINRFRAVLQNYQTTTHVPEALARMTEAYLALGLIEEARKSAAVLGHNFPGSNWYQESFALLGDPAVSGDSTAQPAGQQAKADDGSWYNPVTWFTPAAKPRVAQNRDVLPPENLGITSKSKTAEPADPADPAEPTKTVEAKDTDAKKPGEKSVPWYNPGGWFN